MEKKEWREKLGELSFMKGYYFKLEDNGLVEKKDDQLVFNREELERFVQQELDKAREDVLIELQKEFSEFGVPDDVRYTQPLFYINEVIEKKLSKLKTKEDGK